MVRCQQTQKEMSTNIFLYYNKIKILKEKYVMATIGRPKRGKNKYWSKKKKLEMLKVQCNSSK